MNKFNEEIYNRLQPYERTLRTAYYANYVMTVPVADGREIFEIFNEMFDETKRYSNCPKCMLNVAKRIGEVYFRHQTELGMKPEEVDTVTVYPNGKNNGKSTVTMKKTTKKSGKKTARKGCS